MLNALIDLTRRARGSGRPVPDAASVPAPRVETWTEGEALQVLVANRSDRPVHDVQAFVTLGRRADCVGWIRTLPPTGDSAAQVALTADGRERWISWQHRKGFGEVEVECTFRDDAGQYWRCGRDGALVPIQR
ncbi:hypothetical protein IEQ44_03810 [Nocardioides sp. Y6]|uniref:Uncharacterized protein n=1 Tax=Nocardioides malaquae TaxID=2773426 RepID=A0ABR9RQC8_9ACTN|nr:hypothetical protein [Nocardioides malaquae]MBE7323774.1 hypothetical protein [Nocardioides malaquae]